MILFRRAAVSVLLALCCAPLLAQGSLSDYERAAKVFGGENDSLVTGGKVDAHWLQGGDRFWYRTTTGGGKEFIVVDAIAGTRAAAFDHDRLAAALSDATGNDYVGRNLPFDRIVFSIKGDSIDFDAAGKKWCCTFDNYTCFAVGEVPTPAEKKKAAWKRPEDPPEKGLSPDGLWQFFTKDHNLHVRRVRSKTEYQLTTDGCEGHSYLWPVWSPDSERIVAYRTEWGANRKMHMIRSREDDQHLRPRVESHVYALPGDVVDRSEIWIFDLSRKPEPPKPDDFENGKRRFPKCPAVRADIDRIDWGGAPVLHWSADGSRFIFVKTDRGYQRVRVVDVDAASGRTRTIIDERSETFVDPHKRVFHILADTGAILWASERDGWNHLYLIDSASGAVRGQITRGAWAVRSVERVDEARREIWFTAGGREPGQSPYHVHHYVVDFDGEKLVPLTEADGTHTIAWSPDRRYIIDTYSRVDLAPVVELRRAADGALIGVLERADTSRLVAAGWTAPLPFCAKGRDGETDIFGALFFPSHLDRTAKYPLIEEVYAGPQGAFGPTKFSVRRRAQALAELGFVVVQVDGMGTSYRSKAFHDVCYKNLADGGFADRIAWIRAAAARCPFVDLDRVGIYGFSAGGYNAARALIAHNDFYSAAIALAGNHDHRTDKVWWNELWMGYPLGDHYAAQSNTLNATRLDGALLLVHGEVDRNVNMSASTMQFVDALVKADKDFEMLILPGHGHNLGGAYPTRQCWNFFVRHLMGKEPPPFGLGRSAKEGPRDKK